MRTISIAIDGPAGAGKSTIAKIVAKRMNIHYLDTGAMYRAVALKAIEMGLNCKEPGQIIPILSLTDLSISYCQDQQHVYLDGRDVTDLIRTPQVSAAASDIAVIPEVRMMLVKIQRELAQQYSLVLDGRDIGTFVLPDADKKFFLTATVDERARRRWLELIDKGYKMDISEIKKDIENRDMNDMNRTFAPLRKAEDAILIDTTGKTIEQVADEVCSHLTDILTLHKEW
ncbi:MAG: (d)CMP kinase [Clostridiales bacterium]|jgi:cytidylate kinase|nr:(d)CMP kinase [Clostridiales bacterium]